MTETFEQQPFNPGKFAGNPSQRCPCLLLLDVSASMTGEPIRELNEVFVTHRAPQRRPENACAPGVPAAIC
jgi:hypothetical protein